MPATLILEWRGRKLRLDNEGTEVTLKQARVIKRFTGHGVVGFQKALQQMVDDKDLDPELMQAFLWLALAQNGEQVDIADLDDVTLDELNRAMSSLEADGVPLVVDTDPTLAATGSVPPPSTQLREYSTGILTGEKPSTFSNLHTTAASAL